MIFAEHAKLSAEIPLLRAKIVNLEKIDSTWAHTDSVRREQISQYTAVVNQQDQKIKKMKTWSNIKNIIIGGLSIICLIL